MAARAATFVVKRGDVARLAEAASDASRSRFKQTLAESMVEPGEGFGFKGYILVFLFNTAFSSIDDLDPEHHRGRDIDRAVAQLGSKSPTPPAPDRLAHGSVLKAAAGATRSDLATE